jgi:hypothetical protein
MEQATTHPPEQDSLDRLRELVFRVQTGEQSVLPELRQVLEAHPEIWEQCGDLAAQAQAAWLQLIAGTDVLLHESVSLKVEAMRAELVRDDLIRRQDSAQRRYLAAVRQLAVVRKLLRPALSPLQLAAVPLPESPARRERPPARASANPVLN